MTDEKNSIAADEHGPASSYAGRWVARLRGKIIAQGGTPEQALHAAQKSRHKEKPEIIFMPVPFSVSPFVDRVRAILPDREIYLVGGAVRDMLLNRVSHDLDFALPSKGVLLARRVANGVDGARLEFRGEVLTPDGRNVWTASRTIAAGDSTEAHPIP